MLSVSMRGHEDARTALLVAALLSLSGDLVVLIDLRRRWKRKGLRLANLVAKAVRIRTIGTI